ncbi:transcriptional elongation factor [Myxoma virus]|nr:transcriptional elongation factor [Myxoma virus]AQT37767.1 transcriptional elongation factor [Myxoma virus]AQT37937.1 transcriptional elongation factor [Myxoma virus]
MPFRDLILFHLSKFLLTENEDSIKMFVSLCRGFDINPEHLILSVLNKQYLKKLTKVIRHEMLLPDITVCFQDDIVNELLRLRLCKFSKQIKASYKLTASMKGIVYVKDQKIYLSAVNDELLDFLLKEYTPHIYKYYPGKPNTIIGSKIILCGYDKITFFTYYTTHVVTNQRVHVVVTDKCIDSLLQPQHHPLLKKIFDGSNDVVNKVLKHIFYSVFCEEGGGQSP